MGFRSYTTFAFSAFSLFAFKPLWAGNVRPCEALHRDDHSAVYQCESVKVVKILGDASERAERLGALHRHGVLSNRLLEEFSTKAQRTVSSNRIIQKLVGVYLDQWIGQRTMHLRARQHDELKIFAKSSGFPERYLKRALFIPDLGTYSEGKDSLGCTSAVIRGPDGDLSVGRNLDFAGVGAFDTTPTILVYLPTGRSHEHAYLSAAAEGVPWAGITGMNEAGLYFAVHQNFTTDTKSKKANPLLFVGDGLLRVAGNLEEAIHYLSKNRPYGLWTFVLVDFPNKKAATVEVSANRFAVRRMTADQFAQSNHLLAIKDRDAIESGTFSRQVNSRFRYEKVLENLEWISASGKADHPLHGLLEILAYQDSPDGQYSAFRDIQRADTIQSVAIENGSMEEAKFWIGIDRAPTATGRFAGFRIEDFWKRDLGVLPEYRLRDSSVEKERRIRQILYANVYFHAEERKDLRSAYSLLKDETSLSGRLMRAYLALKIKKPEAALRDVENGLDLLGNEARGHEMLEESYWVLKARVLSEIGRSEMARRWARDRLNERKSFYNPDRQRYLERMLEMQRVGHGKWQELRFRNPEKLKWNYAFGDFR